MGTQDSIRFGYGHLLPRGCGEKAINAWSAAVALCKYGSKDVAILSAGRVSLSLDKGHGPANFIITPKKAEKIIAEYEALKKIAGEDIFSIHLSRFKQGFTAVTKGQIPDGSSKSPAVCRIAGFTRSSDNLLSMLADTASSYHAAALDAYKEERGRDSHVAPPRVFKTSLKTLEEGSKLLEKFKDEKGKLHNDDVVLLTRDNLSITGQRSFGHYDFVVKITAQP